MKCKIGKWKNSIIILLLICFSNKMLAQQQPMYSQYMFNMLNINPAFAGATGVPTLTALYRNQWIEMPGAPRNTSLSYDVPVNEKKIGIGLQLFDDRLGIERTTGFNASYAFRVALSNQSTLSLGVQAGILNYRANYTEVQTVQFNDPAFYQNVNGLLPAAAAGLYYNTNKFYFGFSTPALLKTKVSVDNTADVSTATGKDLHLFLASGYTFIINDNFIYKPSILVKAVSGAPIEFDLNSNFVLEKKLTLGVSYRTGDAFVGMIELQIGKQLQLGYAFDKTISNLATYNRGSHEIMLRYGLTKLATVKTNNE